MFFLFLISLHVHIKRPYSFPLIINIQLFCCAGGDLPRPRAIVLPLYSKLLVQFQELVEIIDIKYPLVY